MSLGRYVAGKLLELIPALLLVSVLVFVLVHLTPGDPITTMLGPYASQELIDATRAQYDLDRPLPVQYVLWLGKVVRGDLGRSIQTREPVATMIGDRLGVTVSLAVWATLFSCLISVPAGVAAAVHRGRPLDTATIGVTSLFLSIPDFVAATAFVLVGGVTLRLLPMVGYVSVFGRGVAERPRPPGGPSRRTLTPPGAGPRVGAPLGVPVRGAQPDAPTRERPWWGGLGGSGTRRSRPRLVGRTGQWTGATAWWEPGSASWAREGRACDESGRPQLP